ncbi:MAG: GNAT family N-acetyltransferase [Lachnospiraceae bacterium]|nr:GNAT family N-acetyltransferase [Lachnospiraceae bacterium]
MINVGVIPVGNPGVFCSLLLPEAADALAAGEPLTALGLIQEEDELAVGAVAGYLIEENTSQIISLYVAPDYRRQGAGRLLMETLTGLLDEIQTGIRIDFTVTRKEHEDLEAFLKALGFQDDTNNDENIYLASLESLSKVCWM